MSLWILLWWGEFVLFVVQILSKPCLSLSFAFTWKAKCLLLLPPPPPPWSGPSPHCMRLRRTLLLTLCLYLSYSLNDIAFLFLPEKTFFPLFLCHWSYLFWFDFTMRWFALCERSVCLCIFPPVECCKMSVADFQMPYLCSHLTHKVFTGPALS